APGLTPPTIPTITLDPTVEPYASDPSLSQTHPAALALPTQHHLLISWRTPRLTADPTGLGEELFLADLTFDPITQTLTHGPEILLPRSASHSKGDQRFPALAASIHTPPSTTTSAFLAAWTDYGKTLPSSGAPDVVAELIPVPAI